MTVEAWYNLAQANASIGRHPEAGQVFERSVSLDDANVRAQSSCLLLLNYSDHLSAEEVFAAHQSWGRRVEGDTQPASASRDGMRRHGLRWRIGYVSADFVGNPTFASIETD